MFNDVILKENKNQSRLGLEELNNLSRNKKTKVGFSCFEDARLN